MSQDTDRQPSLFELIVRYNNTLRDIHSYFGYEEDWCVLPLDDQSGKYWMLFEESNGDGRYVFSDVPFTKDSLEAGDKIYSGTIYTQRFLPKWVYRADTHTMVCADTHTDGNRFLMIFDNTLECTDDALKQLYMERWES